MGFVEFRYLLESLCLVTLERGETPMVLCEESPDDLIICFGYFQLFCNHEILITLNLLILLVLASQQEKSQTYFDLSAFNWNSNHSNL